jgi:GTP pyrophosphokinase
LERYFKRRGLARPLESQLETAARELIRTASPEDLYIALSNGRVTAQQVAKILIPKQEAVVVEKPRSLKNNLGIRLESDLTAPMKLASCCGPAKGDPILGYITRGRGVSIHKAECPNLRRLMEQDTGRIVLAHWEGIGRVMNLEVLAEDRAGLLRDVMDVIASMNKSAMGVSSNPLGAVEKIFSIQTRIETSQHEQDQLDKRLREVPSVQEVRWSQVR